MRSLKRFRQLKKLTWLIYQVMNGLTLTWKTRNSCMYFYLRSKEDCKTILSVTSFMFTFKTFMFIWLNLLVLLFCHRHCYFLQFRCAELAVKKVNKRAKNHRQTKTLSSESSKNYIKLALLDRSSIDLFQCFVSCFICDCIETEVLKSFADLEQKLLFSGRQFLADLKFQEFQGLVY